MNGIINEVKWQHNRILAPSFINSQFWIYRIKTFIIFVAKVKGFIWFSPNRLYFTFTISCLSNLWQSSAASTLIGIIICWRSLILGISGVDATEIRTRSFKWCSFVHPNSFDLQIINWISRLPTLDVHHVQPCEVANIFKKLKMSSVLITSVFIFFSSSVEHE